MTLLSDQFHWKINAENVHIYKRIAGKQEETVCSQEYRDLEEQRALCKYMQPESFYNQY